MTAPNAGSGQTGKWQYSASESPFTPGVWFGWATFGPNHAPSMETGHSYPSYSAAISAIRLLIRKWEMEA